MATTTRSFPYNKLRNWIKHWPRQASSIMLEVIPGGGYDDKTFGPGLMKAIQWFKDELLKSESEERLSGPRQVTGEQVLPRWG